MRIKLADRTIQSLISLKHRWRNPLNRMKSSGVGLYPLPVELWLEIFAIATNQEEYWDRAQELLSSISTPFFFAEEDNIFRSSLAMQHRLLLQTRYSIILVCKSWYFMGIPFLWSHLHFDEGDPRNIATLIYSALKRNPNLASHVVRLTIKSVLFRRENLLQPEKIHAVAKFVSLLTNLEAITCSIPYAAHLCPVTQPRMVILNNHGKYGSRNHVAVGPARLMLRNSFWIHCSTLSLKLVRAFWDDWGMQHYDKSQLRFENLTSLRLEVRYPAVMRWIEESWQFPILKNLSLIDTTGIDRISFLQRLQMTLERLQICCRNINRCSFDRTREVELPKLKKLTLVNARHLYLADRKYWFTAIKAPKLWRLVISLRLTLEMMVDHEEGILECFPSVQEVLIVILKRYCLYARWDVNLVVATRRGGRYAPSDSLLDDLGATRNAWDTRYYR